MAIETVAVFNASSRQGIAQLKQLSAQGFRAIAITRNRSVLEEAGVGEVASVAADNADVVTRIEKYLETARTDSATYYPSDLTKRQNNRYDDLGAADDGKR